MPSRLIVALDHTRGTQDPGSGLSKATGDTCTGENTAGRGGQGSAHKQGIREMLWGWGGARGDTTAVAYLRTTCTALIPGCSSLGAEGVRGEGSERREPDGLAPRPGNEVHGC